MRCERPYARVRGCVCDPQAPVSVPSTAPPPTMRLLLMVSHQPRPPLQRPGHCTARPMGVSSQQVLTSFKYGRSATARAVHLSRSLGQLAVPPPSIACLHPLARIARRPRAISIASSDRRRVAKQGCSTAQLSALAMARATPPTVRRPTPSNARPLSRRPRPVLGPLMAVRLPLHMSRGPLVRRSGWQERWWCSLGGRSFTSRSAFRRPLIPSPPRPPRLLRLVHEAP